MADRSIAQLNLNKLSRDGSNTVTGSIDFDLFPIINLVADRGPALPGTGAVGQMFFLTSGTPGLYVHDGITWNLLDAAASFGTQISAEQIDPVSAYSSRILPLDITNSYPITSFNFRSTPASHVATGSSIGEAGYEQTLSLKQKANLRITGDHNPHADFRVSQMVTAAALGPETYTENEVFVGSGSSLSIEHNLNDVNHFVIVGIDAFNQNLSAADLADVGVVWVQVGANTDIIHNTGAAGIKLAYMATTATITTDDVTPNGMTGVTFTHNLGTLNHVCMIQPICTSAITEVEAATMGAFWAVLGTNADTIYHSGGSIPNITFRCAAIAT